MSTGRGEASKNIIDKKKFLSEPMHSRPEGVALDSAENNARDE